MALRGASTTIDVARLDWEELARENAAVVFTVREIEPEQTFGKNNKPIRPVKARVIVLTGPQAGAIYPDERVMRSGIRPKLEAVKVGDDVVGRIGFYSIGSQSYVGLEAEEAGDIELAEKALAKANGHDIKVPAQNKGRKLAAVEEDDEPPF
jgi:hypothetical protein